MYSGVSVNSPMGTISVEVMVDDMSAPMFMRADGKRFIVGTPGKTCMLKVTNLMPRSRIEVIATIDGRHVLDDEEGDSFRNRGFVIAPRTSYTFRGWRTSREDSVPFAFADPGNSVAVMAAGTTTNLGVIGFAVHRERYPETYHSVAVAAASASPFPFEGGTAEGMSGRSASVGMGMGSSPQHDPVGSTTFNRDGANPDILAIGYDTEAALQDMGILRPSDPNPFPGTGKTGYSKFIGG